MVNGWTQYKTDPELGSIKRTGEKKHHLQGNHVDSQPFRRKLAVLVFTEELHWIYKVSCCTEEMQGQP